MMTRFVLALAMFVMIGCGSTESNVTSPTTSKVVSVDNIVWGTSVADRTNCEAPNDGRIGFYITQLGSVEVTNWSNCTNDYSLRIFELTPQGQLNVSWSNKKLKPFEVTVIQTNFPLKCGATYQRDLVFGVTLDRAISLDEMNTFKFYGDPNLWHEPKCDVVPPIVPPPTPKCEDHSATNYGQSLPCVFPLPICHHTYGKPCKPHHP